MCVCVGGGGGGDWGRNESALFSPLHVKMVLRHLGFFGLDISTTDISATENAEGGRFGNNHKFWVWNVCMHKCVMHFFIF